MKIALMSLVTALVIGLVATPSTPAPTETPMGRLHRIDLTAKKPKAYHPQVGDLVKCYFNFPILPGKIPTGIETTITGPGLALVNVVSTSRPGIVGSGQISAYFVPRRKGESRVTFEIPVPDSETRTFTLRFQVEVERAR